MNERLTQMESVSYGDANLTVNLLPHFVTFAKNNPGLKQFSLTNCRCLSGQFLTELTGILQNLEHLGIGFVNDNHRSLLRNLILSYPKLHSLDIRGYYQGMFFDIEDALSQLPHLKTLYFDPWFVNHAVSVDPGLSHQIGPEINYLNSKFPDHKFIVTRQ
jgi:hypothetical protein